MNMKLTVLLLAFLVATATAWPQKRKAGNQDAKSEDSDEEEDGNRRPPDGAKACKDLGKLCDDEDRKGDDSKDEKPVERALRQFLREEERKQKEEKCNKFMKEVEASLSKRGGDSDQDVMDDVEAALDKCVKCEGGDDKPDDTPAKRLLSLLRRDDQESQGDKCDAAVDELLEDIGENDGDDKPENPAPAREFRNLLRELERFVKK